MNTTSRRALSAIAFALLFVLVVQADEKQDAQPRKAEWRIWASDGRSMQNWHGQAQLQSLNFERSKRYPWRTEFGFIFSPHIVTQPREWAPYLAGDREDNVFAGSASLMVRHRFNSDKNFAQPFIEISSGPMWAQRRIPANTSHFNFISQLGLGYVFHPQNRASLIVGWRFAHISNGGYAPRNPGLNINSLMIGTRLR